MGYLFPDFFALEIAVDIILVGEERCDHHARYFRVHPTLI